ncbi:hypothetical protein [Nocardiopsis kunsanensis]|uniref:DUF3618 domain-containing protein n=1 Tax=Nocardiopsis kunsanensis TaxID=141693 RepID=A0A919CK24_9ACTN|nr:hypothetical protein [Nocardiopsis kunsanensis]GHD32082.1 hypothetical protein GCM10007147_35330 [Nocardiopsis kunsanensis]
MPITTKRRKAQKEAEVAVVRLQDLAREQAERLGPYAGQARDQASRKLLQARGWTAPRLETAAHRVEDTVAPRVAELLTTAAHRVDPKPSRRGLRALRQDRKVSRTLLIGGAAVVGGVLVYSLVRMRQASQDAEWQEHLDQARDQVRETRENLGTNVSEANGKATKNSSKETARAGTGSDKGGSTKSS